MDVGQILMKGTSGPKNTAETDQAGRTEYKNGRTVGNPKLSKEGAKYYEELKKKYGDMDFVLVSAEEKENAKKERGCVCESREAGGPDRYGQGRAHGHGRFLPQTVRGNHRQREEAAPGGLSGDRPDRSECKGLWDPGK